MTSVEYAVEKLEKFIPSGNQLVIEAILEQAKEMHKKEIMQAVYDSMGTNFDPNMGRAELYYNETFKSE
jgi:DNA-binding PadR family transcriptional regulator